MLCWILKPILPVKSLVPSIKINSHLLIPICATDSIGNHVSVTIISTSMSPRFSSNFTIIFEKLPFFQSSEHVGIHEIYGKYFIFWIKRNYNIFNIIFKNFLRLKFLTQYFLYFLKLKFFNKICLYFLTDYFLYFLTQYFFVFLTLIFLIQFFVENLNLLDFFVLKKY